MFDLDITALGPKGVGVAHTDTGREVHIRTAPPGSRITAQVVDRRKGILFARRTATLSLPADAVTPKCVSFGTCGGCALQELPLDTQRRVKRDAALRAIAKGGPLPEHVELRGASAAYGYRNRIELTFGPRRWRTTDEIAAGAPAEGRFLGFHAPERFDRIVDVTRCELVSERVNALITALRTVALRDDVPPPRDPRVHVGFWRFVRVREGHATGELLVTLYTSTDDDGGAVAEAVAALQAVDLGPARLAGVVWCVDDGRADVARGEVRQVWGQDHITERLGRATYKLSSESFFQTSTEGALLLYDTIGEALGTGGTLVDLYCGTGTIGIHLADRHDAVLGIEEVESSVRDARANAATHGVNATYVAGRVEAHLAALAEVAGPRHVVVDPPRAGVHPRVAQALADMDADSLVYVACNPDSLGRDRAFLEVGGWRLTALWIVDLFPQTGHVEAVARFTRDGGTG